MNEFLRYLEKIYRENNITDYKTIYSLLITSNINRENIEEFFDKWIKVYSKRKKDISVFRDDNWRYFCQFMHPVYKENLPKDNKMIKLYFSFHKPFMDKAARIIFDYLCKKKIFHISKIGSYTRNDSIVIRVNNLDDARKIIRFVNGDSFLKKNMVSINPFVYQEDGIGITIDGNNSYNSELAKLLFKYFNFRKIKKINTPPNIMEFRNFISPLYVNTRDESLKYIYSMVVNMLDGAMNKDKFSLLVDNYQGNEKRLYMIMNTLYLNYGADYVFLALKNALKGDYKLLIDKLNFDEHEKRFLSSSSIEGIIKRNLGYNNSKVLDQNDLIAFISKILYMEKNALNKIDILIEAIKETSLKHNYDLDKIILLLNLFVKKQSYEVFTRDNGWRELIRKYISPNEVIPLLRNKYNDSYSNDNDLLMNFILQEVISQSKKR